MSAILGKTQKRVLFVLFGMFVFLLTPRTVRADADGPDFWAVVNVAQDDVLNVRVGPDYRAEKIGEIPFDGSAIKNLGCNGPDFSEWIDMTEAEQTQARDRRWCQIDYKGTVGWVKGKYLREDDS